MQYFDSLVHELLAIEPFWKICFPCKFKGYCCIGAEISFSDAEMQITKEYIKKLSPEEKDIIVQNNLSSKHCIYRAPDKCLIHDVRPMNCRYTPFQCGINPQNELLYSMVKVGSSGHCEFKSQKLQLSEPQATLLRSQKFLRLENFDRQTYYLSLNHLYSAHKEQSQK